MVDTISLPLIIRWLQPYDFPHKLGLMDRFFKRQLARHGICWAYTSTGIPWKLDLQNSTHRWIVYGKYEGAAFLNWARDFLTIDGVIVDSGASIGQMLLYTSQWVPKGMVLAYEPGSRQADWLAECLAANSALPVELIRKGLGAASATLHLHDGGLTFTHGGQSVITETKGVPVEIVRLEDELAKRSIKRVDLWKLDVEGYEIPALTGAQEYLKNHQIRAIYVELHGTNGEQICRFLGGYGYDGFLINEDGRLTRIKALPEHTNGLFFPRVLPPDKEPK